MNRLTVCLHQTSSEPFIIQSNHSIAYLLKPSNYCSLVFVDYIFDSLGTMYIGVTGGWHQNLWGTVMRIIGKPGATLMDFVSELWTMSTTALQTIKDGVTSFVDGIKVAGEFIANNIIRPMLESFVLVIRKFLLAMFQTIAASSHYDTVETTNGFRFTSHLDGKIVDVLVYLSSDLRLVFSVGGREFGISLMELLLTGLTETLGIGTQRAEDVKWLFAGSMMSIYISLASFSFIDETATSTGPGAIIPLFLGVFSGIFGSSLFIYTLSKVFTVRGELSPAERRAYDKEMSSWFSSLFGLQLLIEAGYQLIVKGRQTLFSYLKDVFIDSKLWKLDGINAKYLTVMSFLFLLLGLVSALTSPQIAGIALANLSSKIILHAQKDPMSKGIRKLMNITNGIFIGVLLVLAVPFFIYSNF